MRAQQGDFIAVHEFPASGSPAREPAPMNAAGTLPEKNLNTSEAISAAKVFSRESGTPAPEPPRPRATPPQQQLDEPVSHDHQPEPPAEVIVEAVDILRNDCHGRWHVRAPNAAGRRYGSSAFDISDTEVHRMVREVWPKHLAEREQIASRYGIRADRVQLRWQDHLKAALDRETAARRAFGRRREKFEQARKPRPASAPQQRAAGVHYR